MRKRILSMLLCFCMVLGLLPVSALAVDGPAVKIGGVNVAGTDWYAITNAEGTVNAEGASVDNWNIHVEIGDTATVTLKDATIAGGSGYGIQITYPTNDSSVKVVLSGENHIISGSYAIMALRSGDLPSTSADVDVQLIMEGSGSLTTNATWGISATNLVVDGASLDMTTAGHSAMRIHRDLTIKNGAEITTKDSGDGGDFYIDRSLKITDSTLDMSQINVEYPSIYLANSYCPEALRITPSVDIRNSTLAIGGAAGSSYGYGVYSYSGGISINDSTLQLTSNLGMFAAQNSDLRITGNSLIDCAGKPVRASNVEIGADALVIGNVGATDVNVTNNGTILGTVSGELSGNNAIAASYGGDASGGLDLSTNTPTETTYYKAGDGYAIFTPATTDPVANAKLLLHNASISVNGNTALKLGAETIIQLEGTNSITNSNTKTSEGITAYNDGELPLTIQGGSGGSLTVSAWQCTRVDDLTISGGSVTMNGLVYGIHTEGNVVLQNGAQVSASGGDSGPALMIGYNTPYNLTVTGSSSLTTSGNTSISGNLTVESGSTITTQTGDEFWINTATSITNNGTIHNNGIFVLPYSYTAAQVKATNIPGTIKLYDSENDTFKIYANGEFYADGGKLTNSLNLSIPPEEATYYEVTSGRYIIFTPQSGETPAMLTLHDVNNSGYLTEGIILPDTPMTLKLEGENYFSRITASNNIAISGDGLLNSKISNSNASAVLTTESGATLNALYQTETGGVTTYTIYGSYSGGRAIDQTERLILTPGAVWTLEWGNALLFEQNTPLGNLTFGAGASIVNNSNIVLPQGTTAAQIAELPLSGTGVVVVPTSYNDGDPATWDTYTNDGAAVKIVGDSSGLDLTTGYHSGKTVEKDGYSWDGSTLTLGNAYIGGDLTVPGNATIHTTSSSSIRRIMGDAGTTMHLTFTGTAPLTINGGISAGSNGDTVTVQEGAQVTVNGYLSLGEGGDGELIVTGSGSAMKVSSSNGYAVYCQTVKVANGASLTAKAEGSDSVGVEALKPGGSVSVTGGSTLTVGCDYGVYVVDGTFTVDDSSTFTANASVAAVCVVDTTKIKPQSQTLAVSSSLLSSGTKITSAVGNTNGYGYTYWSIANSASTLTATDESNTLATLAGALGALTLKKASTGNNNNNGGSVSYTLSFETGGGTAISSVSKASGTAVDLSGYKPTRDGYDFDGWYSDTALTTKVTSVTLTKSTTVYAKWTEKTAQSANPFSDVADSAYYHDAVLWAVEKSVTSGTTNTTFSPDMICTRAQAVTFLWRAEDSPEPTSANCPFTDVSKDAYYYKAVLWAVEKGITKGTSATTFSPSDTVTRSQSMTFLWRTAGEATAASVNPFADVTKDAYYYNAVLWAVEKGITKGTSATAFSPDNGCTRAQIVTFLYRYMEK